MKTTPLRLQFATGSLARQAVEEWDRIPGLTVKIVQGRLAPESSSLDVVATGTPACLLAFKRWNDARVA